MIITGYIKIMGDHYLATIRFEDGEYLEFKTIVVEPNQSHLEEIAAKGFADLSDQDIGYILDAIYEDD